MLLACLLLLLVLGHLVAFAFLVAALGNSSLRLCMEPPSHDSTARLMVTRRAGWRLKSLLNNCLRNRDAVAFKEASEITSIVWLQFTYTGKVPPTCRSNDGRGYDT